MEGDIPYSEDPLPNLPDLRIKMNFLSKVVSFFLTRRTGSYSIKDFTKGEQRSTVMDESGYSGITMTKFKLYAPTN